MNNPYSIWMQHVLIPVCLQTVSKAKKYSSPCLLLEAKFDDVSGAWRGVLDQSSFVPVIEVPVFLCALLSAPWWSWVHCLLSLGSFVWCCPFAGSAGRGRGAGYIWLAGGRWGWFQTLENSIPSHSGQHEWVSQIKSMFYFIPVHSKAILER